MAASGENAPGNAQNQSPSANQRNTARQRVLLSGRLVYGEADLTIDCSIRDLSETGAKIRTAGPVALPQRLHLIELRSARAFECEVAWRKVPEVGLRFVGEPKDLNSSAPELKMLRRVWIEGSHRYSLP
jgi:hypothetical protein